MKTKAGLQFKHDTLRAKHPLDLKLAQCFFAPQIVENLHAPYFRHDQISVILHQSHGLSELQVVL